MQNARGKLLRIGLIALLFALFMNSQKYKKGTEEANNHGHNRIKTPDDKPVITPQGTGKQSDRSQQPKKRFWRDYEPIEKFNFFLVIATLGLVGVAAFQAWAFVASERAFVSVTITGIDEGKLIVGKPVVILSQVTNTGKSTAFILDGTIDFRTNLKGQILSDIPVYIKGGLNIQGPLTANTTLTATTPITNHLGNVAILRDEDVDRIDGGGATIFVFGYITYRDDFSIVFGDRTTGFCAALNAHNGKTNGTFEGCGKPAYVYSR